MFTININGYGREVFAGKVKQEVYDYFLEKDIDITAYAKRVDFGIGEDDPASGLDIPEEYDFGAYGLYDTDDLWHISSPILSEGGTIEITDENSELIWTATLDDLEEAEIKLIKDFDSEEVLNKLPKPTFVMSGYRPSEEISYINAEIDADFDLDKLTIYYGNYDGLIMISKVEYDGEELEIMGDSESDGDDDDQEYKLFSTEDI